MSLRSGKTKDLMIYRNQKKLKHLPTCMRLDISIKNGITKPPFSN